MSITTPIEGDSSARQGSASGLSGDDVISLYQELPQLHHSHDADDDPVIGGDGPPTATPPTAEAIGQLLSNPDNRIVRQRLEADGSPIRDHLMLPENRQLFADLLASPTGRELLSILSDPSNRTEALSLLTGANAPLLRSICSPENSALFNRVQNHRELLTSLLQPESREQLTTLFAAPIRDLALRLLPRNDNTRDASESRLRVLNLISPANAELRTLLTQDRNSALLRMLLETSNEAVPRAFFSRDPGSNPLLLMQALDTQHGRQFMQRVMEHGDSALVYRILSPGNRRELMDILSNPARCREVAQSRSTLEQQFGRGVINPDVVRRLTDVPPEGTPRPAYPREFEEYRPAPPATQPLERARPLSLADAITAVDALPGLNIEQRNALKDQLREADRLMAARRVDDATRARCLGDMMQLVGPGGPSALPLSMRLTMARDTLAVLGNPNLALQGYRHTDGPTDEQRRLSRENPATLTDMARQLGQLRTYFLPRPVTTTVDGMPQTITQINLNQSALIPDANRGTSLGNHMLQFAIGNLNAQLQFGRDARYVMVRNPNTPLSSPQERIINIATGEMLHVNPLGQTRWLPPPSPPNGETGRMDPVPVAGPHWRPGSLATVHAALTGQPVDRLRQQMTVLAAPRVLTDNLGRVLISQTTNRPELRAEPGMQYLPESETAGVAALTTSARETERTGRPQTILVSNLGWRQALGLTGAMLMPNRTDMHIQVIGMAGDQIRVVDPWTGNPRTISASALWQAMRQSIYETAPTPPPSLPFPPPPLP